MVVNQAKQIEQVTGMRLILGATLVLALAGCQPSVPDSGVGFGDYNTYQQSQAARDAQLAGSGTPLAAPVVSEETILPGTDGAIATGTVPSATTPQPLTNGGDAGAEALAARAEAALNSGVAPVQASPDNPAPEPRYNPGISDENDFEAVSARQSIESDAERIRRNTEQYTVIAPTELPEREGSAGPNIVEYALSTSNPKGTRVYNRSAFNTESKYQRNCAKYASPDLAQIEFLAKGGPQRDRLGLDPDGDGYACAWDPRPFRQAVQN